MASRHRRSEDQMANRTIGKAGRAPGALSRQEAKLVTRNRLLRAGLALLAEAGYEGLTTGRVARRAGVAQPTFYVHFRDKDALLGAIAVDAVSELRVALREVRLRLGRGGDLLAVTREAFRLPLAVIAAQHGDVLRLFLSELHRPHSEFGRSARALVAELTADLVEDIAAAGIAAAVSAAQLALIAETVVMLTIHFGLALVDGRSPELDGVAELLARTTVQLLLDAATHAPAAGSPPASRARRDRRGARRSPPRRGAATGTGRSS
jgi:AcrR family transcriptional regulator